MGTSILTNNAAMTAMKTLRNLSLGLDNTQERVSTGKNINKAADNTAYWSISSMMQSDRSTLNAASDGMKLGQKQIATANTAVDQTKKNLDKINAHLMTDYQKGDGDVQKIQNAVRGELNALKAAVSSATMAEKNILGNNGEVVRVAGAYRREGSATYVDMIDVGSQALNFASKGKDGVLDFTQGQLKDAFGSAGSDVMTKVNDQLVKLGDAETDNADAKKLFEDTRKEAQKALTKWNELPKTVPNSDPDNEEPETNPDLETEWAALTGEGGALKAYVDAALEYNGTVIDVGTQGSMTVKTAGSDDQGTIRALQDEKDALKALLEGEGDAQNFTLQDFVDADLTGISASGLEVMVKHLQQMTTDVTQNVVAAGAELGVAEKQIGDQIDFVANLMSAVDQGIGAMVDADMTAESARLASLQVQQQLGIQALSIANQNNQNLLSLFRG